VICNRATPRRVTNPPQVGKPALHGLGRSMRKLVYTALITVAAAGILAAQATAYRAPAPWRSPDLKTASGSR